jgi:peptide/nickel transport system permease protein
MTGPVTDPAAPSASRSAVPFVPSGRIGWQRRTAAGRRAWAEFRSNPAGLAGLAILVLYAVGALAAPALIPAHDLSVTGAPGQPLQPPSARFWLGTDTFGRPMSAVTLWGARISLTVGFLATLITIVIGTVTGIVAGHFRGWVSVVLMRVTDWFLVLPLLLLAVVLAAVLGPGAATVIIAVGVTAWPPTTRLVRAQALTLEQRPYVERARALGAGHWHVMTRHVLPGVMPIVLVQATLTVSGSIIAEATLAFLGLEDPTKISWGTTLQLASLRGAVVEGAWWVLLPPGIAIAVIALAFVLCGRALEGVLNPRLRRRA